MTQFAWLVHTGSPSLFRHIFLIVVYLAHCEGFCSVLLTPSSNLITDYHLGHIVLNIPLIISILWPELSLARSLCSNDQERVFSACSDSDSNQLKTKLVKSLELKIGTEGEPGETAKGENW